MTKLPFTISVSSQLLLMVVESGIAAGNNATGHGQPGFTHFYMLMFFSFF
jgi:hypothetical protein